MKSSGFFPKSSVFFLPFPKDTGDFDGEEVYGFRGDFEQHKERRREETKLEIERQEEIIDTYSNDTQDWEEAQM